MQCTAVLVTATTRTLSIPPVPRSFNQLLRRTYTVETGLLVRLRMRSAFGLSVRRGCRALPTALSHLTTPEVLTMQHGVLRVCTSALETSRCTRCVTTRLYTHWSAVESALHYARLYPASRPRYHREPANLFAHPFSTLLETLLHS